MRKQNAEKRAARVSRQCAKLIIELRRDGQHDGAARLEAVAVEVVDRIRQGAA